MKLNWASDPGLMRPNNQGNDKMYRESLEDEESKIAMKEIPLLSKVTNNSNTNSFY